MQKGLSLLRRNGDELDPFLGVRSPTRRTETIQVFLDMVPAESTDLRAETRAVSHRQRQGKREKGRHTW